jgi:hypothetical protein
MIEDNDGLEDRLQGHIDETLAKEKGKADKNGKATSEKSDDTTQAQQLTKISTAAGLFHTPNGTGYADVSVNGHRETWQIRSKAFKQWLVREFYQRDGAGGARANRGQGAVRRPQTSSLRSCR